MVWFYKAWMALPDKNFTNCFCRCRVFVETAVSAIADDDDLLTGLVEEFLRKLIDKIEKVVFL